MIKYLIPTLLFLVSCSSEGESQQEDLIDPTNDSEQTDVEMEILVEKANYTCASIYSEDIGWGYTILNNEKPYINQPHIPAISGVQGFESEEDALKTGEFAVYKLQNGIVPPTINIEELDSLGVLKNIEY